MKTIPLTKGLSALVDDSDFEWLNQWKWHASRKRSKTYACNNQKQTMHRVLLSAPQELTVDHINSDSLDNRRKNLRLATMAQNLVNRGMNKNNTSGYKGVTWAKEKCKWKAQLKVSRKNLFLGYYVDRKEAARAYDQAIQQHFGEFAQTNF